MFNENEVVMVSKEFLMNPFVSLNAKGLYYILKTFLENENEYPSIRKLSHYSDMTTNSVLKYLYELEVNGFIKIEKNGKFNSYKILN